MLKLSKYNYQNSVAVKPGKVDSMNTMTKILFSAALMFVAPLALACDYPAPPRDLPDGDSSEKTEMLVGVKKISAYQESMSEYLSCIEADEVVAMQALADDDAKKQRKTMFDKKYNAAVNEQTRVVEQFNLEIRAYKARSR